MSSKAGRRLRLGVFKFASCDGCQLSLLDLEDELLTLADDGRDRVFSRSIQQDEKRALRYWLGGRVHYDAA